MKRHHFTTMEEVKLAQLILRGGVLVAERKDRLYKVKLFQVEQGYLEVFYHSNFRVIIKANHFEDPAFLDPYLSGIDISEVLP
jgi:hypothetical protein